MSQLWIERDTQWYPVLLVHEAYVLGQQEASEDLPLRCRRREDERGPREAIELLRSDESGSDVWALLSVSDEVRINGLALAGGLRALRDHDEIRVGRSQRYYFSTEMPAKVEPFPREDGSGCPRCQMPIDYGTPSVRCPGCDVWYHQNEQNGRECYSYGPDCVVCRRSTYLDGGFDWTPDDV